MKTGSIKGPDARSLRGKADDGSETTRSTERSTSDLQELIKLYGKKGAAINLDDLPSDLDKVRALVGERLGGALAAQQAHHTSPALASKIGRRAQDLLEKLNVYLKIYGDLVSLAASSEPAASTACQALSMLIVVIIWLSNPVTVTFRQ